MKQFKIFKRDYKKFKNKELAIIYGVSIRTIINHAKKLGLSSKKRGRPIFNFKKRRMLHEA